MRPSASPLIVVTLNTVVVRFPVAGADADELAVAAELAGVFVAVVVLVLVAVLGSEEGLVELHANTPQQAVAIIVA